MMTNLPNVEIRTHNRKLYFAHYESIPCIFMESLFNPKDKRVLRFLSDQHLEIINNWSDTEIEDALKNELNLTFRREYEF